MVVDDGATVIAVPLVTLRLPGVTIPVPLLKTAVSVVELGATMAALPAVKEVMVGSGETVTVLALVLEVLPMVTVRV